MPRGSSKSTAVIQRLLDERRQYEAWIARLGNAADATPESVRVRVKADYEARLAAVTEELKTHAESARQAIDQKKHLRGELQKKEAAIAEKLTETELRHAVGEYDEAQWSQVHKDVLAELLSVREELQAVEADVAKLEELDTLVRGKPATKAPAPRPEPRDKPAQVDELAFIRSVTEDETSSAPSPRRASGAQFQPAIPGEPPPGKQTPPPPPLTSSPVRLATPAPAPVTPTPRENGEVDEATAKTLKCRDCGTMNLPTEWYCEQCGAELLAV